MPTTVCPPSRTAPNARSGFLAQAGWSTQNDGRRAAGVRYRALSGSAASCVAGVHPGGRTEGSNHSLPPATHCSRQRRAPVRVASPYPNSTPQHGQKLNDGSRPDSPQGGSSTPSRLSPHTRHSHGVSARSPLVGTCADCPVRIPDARASADAEQRARSGRCGSAETKLPFGKRCGLEQHGDVVSRRKEFAPRRQFSKQ